MYCAGEENGVCGGRDLKFDVRKMQGEFKQYIISLYKDIPQEVYEGLLKVFCLGVVLFMVFKGVRTGFKWSSVLLLIEYVFLFSARQSCKQPILTYCKKS